MQGILNSKYFQTVMSGLTLMILSGVAGGSIWLYQSFEETKHRSINNGSEIKKIHEKMNETYKLFKESIDKNSGFLKTISESVVAISASSDERNKRAEKIEIVIAEIAKEIHKNNKLAENNKNELDRRKYEVNAIREHIRKPH